MKRDSPFSSLPSLIRPMDESPLGEGKACYKAPLPPAVMRARGTPLRAPPSSIRPMDESPDYTSRGGKPRGPEEGGVVLGARPSCTWHLVRAASSPRRTDLGSRQSSVSQYSDRSHLFYLRKRNLPPEQLPESVSAANPKPNRIWVRGRGVCRRRGIERPSSTCEKADRRLASSRKQDKPRTQIRKRTWVRGGA